MISLLANIDVPDLETAIEFYRDGLCSSHFVAACAAALAAWHWQKGTSSWLAKAQLPWHPFDFAC